MDNGTMSLAAASLNPLIPSSAEWLATGVALVHILLWVAIVVWLVRQRHLDAGQRLLSLVLATVLPVIGPLLVWWVVRRATVHHPEPNPRHRAQRLHIMQGLDAVLEEPHRFLDVVLAAPDEVVVLEALREQFGLDEVQAKATVNMQFRLMTGKARQLMREEVDILRSSGDR